MRQSSRASAGSRGLALRSVALATCIGGSVVERLARVLEDRGVDARTVHELSPEAWRACMAGGPASRALARLRSYAVFPARALWDAVTMRPDVVVATTNPFLLPAALVGTRWLHRRPVVVLVYDLYPDAIEVAGIIRRDGAVSRTIAAVTRYWTARADAVVFIGETMARHAGERYGAPRRQAVLHTGADPREFAPHGVASESELEAFVADRPTFAYVGNMGVMHDWETLATAGRAVLEEGAPQGGERPRFLIAASGPGEASLRRAWSGLDDDDVRFEAPLEDRPWARVLSLAEVAVVSLREEAAETSVPSKTFSAMAAGNAILAIAPARSDLARLVEETGCGEVVAPGDASGLVGAMRRLLDPELRRRCQRRASDAIRDRYGLPVLAAQWEQLLAGCARAPGLPGPSAAGRPPRPHRDSRPATELFWASLDAGLHGPRGAPVGSDALVGPVLERAEEQNLDALCAVGLGHLGLETDGVDRAARCRRAAARSLLLHRDRAILEAALRRHDVRYVLLKGVVSDAQHFSGSGLRGTSDVDVLVDPADVARAHQALREEGWDTDDRDPQLPPVEKPERLYFPTEVDRFNVDLHCRVGKSPPYGEWSQALLDRAVDTDTPVGTLRALPLEEQIVFAAVNQAGQKMIGAPRLAVDVARILERGVDLERVVDECRRLKCGWSLYALLKIARDRLGTDVPRSLLVSAEPRAPQRQLAELVAGVERGPWLPRSRGGRLVLVEAPLVGDPTWPVRATLAAVSRARFGLRNATPSEGAQ